MTGVTLLARGERGVAVLVTLVALGLVSVVGMAIVLSSSIDRLAAANHAEAAELLNLVEAGLELAARDLSSVGDWDQVLNGSVRSPRAEGSPDGVVYPWPGIAIDLPRLTNLLICGSASSCSDAARRAVALERPWGANNPVWRPFLHLRLSLPSPSRNHEAYVVVWIGDDGSERDGDPVRDGGGPASEGRYILKARAEGFARSGGRRAIDADVARLCSGEGSEAICLPGVRILAWRVVGGMP
jgi:hypothetical protein